LIELFVTVLLDRVLGVPIFLTNKRTNYIFSFDTELWKGYKGRGRIVVDKIRVAIKSMLILRRFFKLAIFVKYFAVGSV
jgi:hypothetical protein